MPDSIRRNCQERKPACNAGLINEGQTRSRNSRAQDTEGRRFAQQTKRITRIKCGANERRTNPLAELADTGHRGAEEQDKPRNTAGNRTK